MRKFFMLMLLSISFLLAVDFQTASKDELMKIKGIGPKKADSIIEYRQTNKIKSIDDLGNIKGFGPKFIAKLKEKKSSK